MRMPHRRTTAPSRRGNTAALSGRLELNGVLAFMQRLWAVNHGLDAASKRMNRQLGVTGPQRLVLRLVGRFPGISAGELARLMHSHPSTLTGVLRRLQSRGFLRRAVDVSDARRLLFRLTSRGRGIDRRRAGTVESAVAAALHEATAAEMRGASMLLVRLVERLDAGAAGRAARRAPAARQRE